MLSNPIFEIAGSALIAQSQRMNVTASNLANAHSVVGPDDQPYRARQPVFQVAPASAGASWHQASQVGVQVAAIVESPTPARLQYEPGHPFANEQGYVAMPNVDVAEEMVNMISASRAYQANVEVINTTRNLMARTLTIGQ